MRSDSLRYVRDVPTLRKKICLNFKGRKISFGNGDSKGRTYRTGGAGCKQANGRWQPNNGQYFLIYCWRVADTN